MFSPLPRPWEPGRAVSGPWTCGLRASIFCHSGCRLPDFAATLGIPLCCLVGNREVRRREIENRYSRPFLRVSPRESGLWGVFCMWLTFQTAGALEVLHIRSQCPTALFMCVFIPIVRGFSVLKKLVFLALKKQNHIGPTTPTFLDSLLLVPWSPSHPDPTFLKQQLD